jgi:four helix bundle protein
MDLVVLVYETTREFPRTEQYGLTSQSRRAAISVVSNIAEGQGRLTYGEWRQMSNARGSLYELQAHILCAQRLEFLDAPAAEAVLEQLTLTGVELAGLIRWVSSRKSPDPPTR